MTDDPQDANLTTTPAADTDEKVTENVFLSEALRLAELGYPVMPCVPDGKRPLTANGLKDATTDEWQIQLWFTDNPTANLALVTDGLIVTDRDTDKATGKRNSDFSPDRELELAAGPHAKTPSGGDHNWFRQRPGQPRRNTVKKLGPNTDTRSDGGYVLVYPSVVDGKAYQWQPGNELDVGPGQLPYAPEWVEDALDEQKPNVVASPIGEAPGVIEGGRNAHLASVGGSLRRMGLDEGEIFVTLLARNAKNLPPLAEVEVRTIAKSVSRYEPDQIATLVAEGCNVSSLSSQSGKFKLNLLSSREFSEKTYSRRYLCKDILVHGQPCMMAGLHKTLKTTQMIDLALSLATGTFFLNHPGFEVVEPVPVAVISGESGGFTMKETAIRIAASKGVELATAGVFWGFELPQVSKPDHLAAVREMIVEHALKAVFIDPAYLCLMGGDTQGRNAGNVFDMGSILMGLTNVGQQTDCTMVLLHHMRKNTQNPFAQPELHDMAFAGFAEWARQWLLIGRRERYEQGSGIHNLWLNAGGSSGHSGMFAVDIDEGTFTDEIDNRKWNVTVTSANEAKQAEQMQRRADKESIENLKVSSDSKRLLTTLAQYPAGQTIRGLREACHMRDPDARKAAQKLLNDGAVENCEVKAANGRGYPGIMLSGATGATVQSNGTQRCTVA